MTEETKEIVKNIDVKEIPKYMLSLDLKTFALLFTIMAGGIVGVSREYFKMNGQLSQNNSEISQLSEQVKDMNELIENSKLVKNIDGDYQFDIEYAGLSCKSLNQRLNLASQLLQQKNCN